MQMYEEQYAGVRWGNAMSARFSIINGTRQGSFASPDLWSVYLDPLLKLLRKLGVGCHVGNVFLGVMAYADDPVLLAPNRAAAVQKGWLCVRLGQVTTMCSLAQILTPRSLNPK